jgi:hypothetical protein
VPPRGLGLGDKALSAIASLGSDPDPGRLRPISTDTAAFPIWVPFDFHVANVLGYPVGIGSLPIALGSANRRHRLPRL